MGHRGGGGGGGRGAAAEGGRGRGAAQRSGRTAGAAGAWGGRRWRRCSSSGYNCIFVGSKGYLGTNGRGEGVGLLPGERWAE